MAGMDKNGYLMLGNCSLLTKKQEYPVINKLVVQLDPMDTMTLCCQAPVFPAVISKVGSYSLLQSQSLQQTFSVTVGTNRQCQHNPQSPDMAIDRSYYDYGTGPDLIDISTAIETRDIPDNGVITLAFTCLGSTESMQRCYVELMQWYLSF